MDSGRIFGEHMAKLLIEKGIYKKADLMADGSYNVEFNSHVSVGLLREVIGGTGKHISVLVTKLNELQKKEKSKSDPSSEEKSSFKNFDDDMGNIVKFRKKGKIKKDTD